MLNDYLLSIGQAPLGFLNYWLYGTGKRGLVDVKSGSNPGCDTDGFSATDGWDPVRSTKLVNLVRHFRRWMTPSSIGHGSRNPFPLHNAESFMGGFDPWSIIMLLKTNCALANASQGQNRQLRTPSLNIVVLLITLCLMVHPVNSNRLRYWKELWGLN